MEFQKVFLPAKLGEGDFVCQCDTEESFAKVVALVAGSLGWHRYSNSYSSSCGGVEDFASGGGHDSAEDLGGSAGGIYGGSNGSGIGGGGGSIGSTNGTSSNGDRVGTNISSHGSSGGGSHGIGDASAPTEYSCSAYCCHV